MTGPSVPPMPPAAPPPSTPPVMNPAPAAMPPAAPHPSAMASMEHEMAAVEAKAAAAMGGMSGPETLIMGGAALFLIVGEILLASIFGGSAAATFLGIGGISLQGVLAGEALFFVWLGRPRAGRAGTISAGAVQAIVGALVLAVVLFEIAELIAVIKNLSGFLDRSNRMSSTSPRWLLSNPSAMRNIADRISIHRRDARSTFPIFA